MNVRTTAGSASVGLRVRRRDDKVAAGVARRVAGKPAQVLAVGNHPLAIARTSCPARVSATTRLPRRTNTLNPELVLEQADVVADARLRRVQRARRLGDVQVLAHDFDEIAQLLELHGGVDSTYPEIL